MKNILINRLGSESSHEISDLLLKNNIEYVKYFNPFAFDKDSIYEILNFAKYDMFFGITVDCWYDCSRLIGFYMLRGMDEGFQFPMYGVFVDAKYQGRGIAKLTISHAESICKFCGYQRILLKVHSENIRAKRLYELAGFSCIEENVTDKNIVLYKNIW